MTLVEALAGTALLGTLLVSILIAGGRLNAQSGRAERRIDACRAADALLEGWWDDPAELPRHDSGDVPGHAGWTWRTSKAESDFAEQLGAQVVALEILAEGESDEKPLARVEVMLPLEEP